MKKMRRWTFGVLVVVSLCGVFSTAADAAVIVANADSHIESANVNRNFGLATTLRVRGSATTWYKTYIRFGLGSIVDLNAVEGVTLSIGTSGANTWNGHTVSVYGLNDGHTGEGWLEGTATGSTGADTVVPGELTWASAPANNTANSNGFTGDATLLGTIPTAAGTTGYLHLSTAQLLSFIKADGNDMVTIMLSGSTGSPTSIIPLDTRASSNNPPKLTLVSVPEPSSMAAVILFGATSMLTGRRRRARGR